MFTLRKKMEILKSEDQNDLNGLVEYAQLVRGIEAGLNEKVEPTPTFKAVFNSKDPEQEYQEGLRIAKAIREEKRKE